MRPAEVSMHSSAASVSMVREQSVAKLGTKLDFIRVYIHVRCTLDCMQSAGLRRSTERKWGKEEVFTRRVTTKKQHLLIVTWSVR